MFTRVATSRQVILISYIELTLTEVKAFTARLRTNQSNHMNCGPMLTKIAYFAIGMIDELPPAQGTAH